MMWQLKRNLSLNRLAVKANLARRPQQNSGRKACIENVARIANALEVSVDYLLQDVSAAMENFTDPEALAGPKGELIEFPTGAKPIVVQFLPQRVAALSTWRVHQDLCLVP